MVRYSKKLEQTERTISILHDILKLTEVMYANYKHYKKLDDELIRYLYSGLYDPLVLSEEEDTYIIENALKRLKTKYNIELKDSIYWKDEEND